jgi:hypothetical protein
MEDFVETVTEAVQGSGAHEYTAEELEAQTTEFLMAFIDSLSDLSEDGKAKLRSSMLERAMNPDMFTGDNMPRKSQGISPQDFLKLIALVMILVVLFGKRERE